MYDSKYDSKMHDITIPLMGFNGFHHASNNESKDDFEDFIGRESILDKLNSWLVDHDAQKGKKYSGAYLITGFRGMGKSSFVYKAILDIKEKAKKRKFTTCHYVPISINVGNDLLTSKELLYIICKLLSVSFDEKTRIGHNKRSRLNLLIARFASILVATYLIFKGYNSYLHFINTHQITIKFYGAFGSILQNIHLCLDKLFHLSPGCLYIISIIIFTLLLCFLLRYIYYTIWRISDWDFFITTWQIKRTFRHLNKRIDSEMTESSELGMDSSKNSAPFDAIPGLKFLKNKTIFYPIAQTAEIQDLLVYQLQLIKRLWLVKFRFIFIIDELDKVSPEDAERQIIPEYEYTNAVKGNSSYRSRQKALAGLLTNMKYFISSSEAKFIFITGYDMYEATLADISNREFNIHSIFNGYINVSSFMRKTGKNKGADSMIEEYLTHLLLPQKDGKRDDLRDYAIFCRNKWRNSDKKTDEENQFFEVLLERRITFLRHFLAYLFYMSNGSPKKISIYLEKYVRSKNRITEQCRLKHPECYEDKYSEIALGYKPYWDKCNWFLYFDENNIQKIEFISYLIYPMIKNLIAKSSIYNDKLLVSTSFMISNLYKFHKSGFSWRNLEYMPELLEINKTPELRDFIGGILEFLNQTHIDEAVSNLYKFKFPQRLSEEITFFSKTSEEVSYLFNFSHDELSSIKTLYNKQLDHYTKDKYEAPAIASMHQLLGDIYMLEENYEQAIFEFNEALAAIRRQEKDDSKNHKDPTNILFTIRVSLKLGLAYEKRKTFDTAYLTYENLVKRLLELALHTEHLPMPDASRKPIKEEKSSYQIISHLSSKTTFFSNIRISYLSIIAKLAVIERLSMGGIRDNDLWRMSNEFELIRNELKAELRPFSVIDFYTKLGIILYYKNNKYNDSIITQLQKHLELTTETDNSKFDQCKNELVRPNENNTHSLLTPCVACQFFNKSIKTCIEEMGGNYEKYASSSKALFFLEHFYNQERSIKVLQKGKLFIQLMANALLGLGNTLLGCAKLQTDNLTDFFRVLRHVCIDLDNYNSHSLLLINTAWLSPYTKSFLYYLAAAKSYEMLSDYKAAYNIYSQILDAVAILHKIPADEQEKEKEASDTTIRFCELITQKAIYCAYLHYDSISCAEVDTQKYEIGKQHIDYINLHTLIVYPEIEIAIDKYHRICLMGSMNKQDEVLIKVLNSRQLGSYKLISTLAQKIQNLSLKVSINEIILSRIIPPLAEAFNKLDLNIGNTISLISQYYEGEFDKNNEIDNLLIKWNWKLFPEHLTIEDKRFSLLDYLIKDSLYCLNAITELLEPLYSTTLYNDSYIGEFYRKAFYWNHILICIRELYSFAETKDKNDFFNSLRSRYSRAKQPVDNNIILNAFIKTGDFLNKLQSWKDYCPNGKSSIESIYEKISPRSSNYLTSSYLTGSAIDRLNKAIEMHTSGKAYHEMMSTLFFLEDDLQNDSNYLHLAIERFLINHGVIQQRIELLKMFAINNSSNTLLQIDNYVKQ